MRRDAKAERILRSCAADLRAFATWCRERSSGGLPTGPRAGEVLEDRMQQWYAPLEMAIMEHVSTMRGGTDDRRRYVRPPQPVHFPASEEMPETNRHLELRTLLYLFLKHELSARATIGSDQFVYYDPTTAKKKLAPDAFVRLGEPHSPFRVWKTWRRGAPDLAVEVVSDSDEADEAWETKLERYRASGIGEVVRFDPDDDERPIRVWDHVDGDLVEREPSADGVVECVPLGLRWVALPHPLFKRVLRLARDRAGRDLVPTPEEEAERARQEEAKARIEAERIQHAEAKARMEAERIQHAETLARMEAERIQHAETLARMEAEKARDALAAEVAELRARLERAASSPRTRTRKPGAPAKKR